jgi:hypothetical protein
MDRRLSAPLFLSAGLLLLAAAAAFFAAYRETTGRSVWIMSGSVLFDSSTEYLFLTAAEWLNGASLLLLAGILCLAIGLARREI